jgi:hypothetical protein
LIKRLFNKWQFGLIKTLRAISNLRESKRRAKDKHAAEQIIGREGETATLLSRCPLNSNGLGGSFAPRQLRRYAFACESEAVQL